MSEPHTSEQGAPQTLPPEVKSLGWVSFFTDLSSEMVYPLNPLFLTGILAAPAWTVGLIEGLAEGLASLLKLYSGWWSDRIGARRPLILSGYSLSTLGKPLIALSGHWGQVLAARLVDRTGKGLRSAPRDALIAEVTPANMRGRAFGYHRAMDTAGAVLGPLIGYGLITASVVSMRTLYWIAAIPAVIGVLTVVTRVREPRRIRSEPANIPLKLPSFGSLSPSMKRYLIIVGLFSLGNSSDAFLMLRANDLGVSFGSLLLLYACFNGVEAALAYPAGWLSDRIPRRRLVAAGYATFALVYAGFAIASTPGQVWALFMGYGLYYTLTQGVQRALAADLAHPDRKGTEMGWFHLIVGVMAIPSSLLAGIIYSYVAPSAPFAIGALTASLAAMSMFLFRTDPQSRPSD